MTTKSQLAVLELVVLAPSEARAGRGRPQLAIRADAARRGIDDGADVIVWNDRGSLRLTATVSDSVRPGVVSVPFGWWSHQHACSGVANSLTSDTITDAGGGVAFHDTLVEVALDRAI